MGVGFNLFGLDCLASLRAWDYEKAVCSVRKWPWASSSLELCWVLYGLESVVSRYSIRDYEVQAICR